MQSVQETVVRNENLNQLDYNQEPPQVKSIDNENKKQSKGDMLRKGLTCALANWEHRAPLTEW